MWTGTVSEDWFDDDNWVGFVPVADTLVAIQTDGPNPPGITGASALSGELQVGDSGSATLSISGGGTLDSGEVFLGVNQSGTGTVHITGAGSQWDITDFLRVGDLGTGTLYIGKDSSVSVSGLGFGLIANQTGSAGQVTVDGGQFSAPGLLRVGTSGTAEASAELVVENAGSVVSSADALIRGVSSGSAEATVRTGGQWITGSNTSHTLTVSGGSKALLTIEGDGSVISAGTVIAGSTAGGTVMVLDGGFLSSNSGVLAEDSGSVGEVTVSGSDAQWDNAVGITVGGSGNAELAIADGGNVTSQSGNVATGVGSTGMVLVTGPGAEWSNGFAMRVGGAGTGAVLVTDGGRIEAVSTTEIAVPSSSGTGVITISGPGSVWDSGFLFRLGGLGNGTVNLLAGGTLSLSGGAGRIDLGLNDGGSGTLNIGSGQAPGILDAGEIRGLDGDSTVHFNHNDMLLDFRNSGDNPIVITQSTAVNHSGPGTTRLTGAHTYTGATSVSNGRLLVDGSLGATAVTIGANGALGGNGMLAGPVSVDPGGTVAPGNGAGTLAVGALDMSADAVLDYELSDPAGAGNDRLDVDGDAVLAGELRISALEGFTGGTFRLINYTGMLVDNGLSITELPPGIEPGQVTIDSSTPGQVNLNVSFVPGPVFTPAPVDFGDQALGVPAPDQPVLVDNVGTADLAVAALAIQGAHAADFSLALDSCSGQIVDAWTSCAFEVGFTPASPGVRTARVVFPSDSPFSPHFLDLLGTNDVIYFSGFESD